MSRELPGPGDVAHDPGSAPECLDCRQPGPTCECQRCAQCADEWGCCDVCKECRRITPDACMHSVCSDCDCGWCGDVEAIARQEAEADQRERDECALEDKGDEMREAW